MLTSGHERGNSFLSIRGCHSLLIDFSWLQRATNSAGNAGGAQSVRFLLVFHGEKQRCGKSRNPFNRSRHERERLHLNVQNKVHERETEVLLTKQMHGQACTELLQHRWVDTWVPIYPPTETLN